MGSRRYLILTLVVLLGLLVCSCSGGHELEEVTARAGEATTEARSYRVAGTATYTSDGEVSEMTWQGEYAAPDRFRVQTALDDGRWCEATKIGEERYVQASAEAEGVGETGGVSCEVLTLSELLAVLEHLVDFEPLPDEEIDGVECIHYRGSVDADALAQRWEAESQQEPPSEVLDLMRRQSMEVELWVGKADYLIRQMNTDARLAEYDPATGQERWGAQSMLMQFYDFNEPVVIEPPSDGSSESSD